MTGEMRCVRGTFRIRKDVEEAYEKKMQEIREMPALNRPYRYPDKVEMIFHHCFKKADVKDCQFHEERDELPPEPWFLERVLQWLDMSHMPMCQYLYWRRKSREAAEAV